MKILFYCCLFLTFVITGCGNYEDKTEVQNNSTESTSKNNNTSIKTNTEGHKYNFRSGTTDNYDVSGYDEDGNYVYGEVDMDNKYGSGSVYDEDGNDIDLDVEWQGQGELEGTDGNGTTYDLETD